MIIGKLWQTRFNELVVFKNSVGHCDVPYKYVKNPKLGRWVRTQRYQYILMRQGKRSPMNVERKKALENVGFRWQVQSVGNSASWMRRYEELKQFKLQKGHCEVPYKYRTNQSLANWVHTQRKQYMLMKRGKSSSMTKDRIDRLEGIQFTWQIEGEGSVPWYTKYTDFQSTDDQIIFKQLMYPSEINYSSINKSLEQTE